MEACIHTGVNRDVMPAPAKIKERPIRKVAFLTRRGLCSRSRNATTSLKVSLGVSSREDRSAA